MTDLPSRRSLRRCAGAILLVSTAFAFTVSGAEILVVEIPAGAAPEWVDSPLARYVEGARIVRVDPATGSVRSLTDGFASACDPAVSPDGTWVLFAGARRSGDSWQIWRMAPDGSEVRQITRGSGSSMSPEWVGALFHLDDDAPTQRILYVGIPDDGPNGAGAAAALYTSDRDGGRPWRITHGLGSALDPEVIPETGRVVYAAYSWQANVGSSGPSSGLMAVNSDGTDLMAYHVDHGRRAVMRSPRVTNDGRLVFVETEPGRWLGGGRLAAVSRRRPLKTHRILAEDPDGFYTDPAPLEDGGILASYRGVGDGSAYELFRLDPVNGTRGDRLHARPGYHCVDAHEIAPWPTPKGRSSVVNMAKETGVFYCLSSHITDRPELGFLKDGAVRSVRVLEGRPSPDGESVQGPLRILGVAPVEDDGSFHVEVPAQIPVTFQLLDTHGLAVARQASWVWVMPREWRGCVGCHEDREMVAPNVLAKAVVKPAAVLTLPPERRRTVDFVHDIAPMVERGCARSDCHGSAAVDLPVGSESDRRTTYDRLVDEWVGGGSAVESPVVRHVLGIEADGRDSLPTVTGNHGLDRVDRALFAEWVDLGAWYDAQTATRKRSVTQ